MNGMKLTAKDCKKVLAPHVKRRPDHPSPQKARTAIDEDQTGCVVDPLLDAKVSIAAGSINIMNPSSEQFFHSNTTG